MVAAWIGNGVVIPLRDKAVTMARGRPSSAKLGRFSVGTMLTGRESHRERFAAGRRGADEPREVDRDAAERRGPEPREAE